MVAVAVGTLLVTQVVRVVLVVVQVDIMVLLV
jgi:hypothetical protein